MHVYKGNRIYPIFTNRSPSGFPYQSINLKTGVVNKQATTTNPAIVGTAIIEFGCLSYLTGDMKYYDAAKKNLQLLKNSQSDIGFVGGTINLTQTSIKHVYSSTDTHIDAGIDSYYEYLLKCWKLFGDEDCLQWWNDALYSITTYLSYYEGQNLWFAIANMTTGQILPNGYQYDLYAAFFAAELALTGELEWAEQNQNANWKMWGTYIIEPGVYNFISDTAVNPSYDLNPENFESNYYLYVFTNNGIYYDRAVEYFNDIVTYCKCTSDCVGYSALQNVSTMSRQNSCPSYFFAESMKYLYLTFMYNLTITQGVDTGFNFDDYVFNTEAHPVPKTWGKLF
ncbi:Mannosyl-oligosaccharide 1,2-alpha-mannosidase [Reticulomyxa filosa]|uniref:alpha-1,2-Mannosidase n=1 Tax=Reticulomyxa filosa TaxID=46433 RepID=X6LMP3_RETFI|nr:Mannosyl-oligosaccharide 1,2-alpha-mannosidase [Reticulomyxa filosa]|eukprot:ETO02661.1 Mannosyl-oligosaccharide 1,2-alpha-mannosidase [Reticulomyxa filosa]